MRILNQENKKIDIYIKIIYNNFNIIPFIRPPVSNMQDNTRKTVMYKSCANNIPVALCAYRDITLGCLSIAESCSSLCNQRKSRRVASINAGSSSYASS